MKKIIKICAAAVFAAITAACVGVFASCPDLSVEKITDISQTLTVLDKDKNVSAVFNSGQNRQSVKIENIPEHVKNALIASEDVRFYKHCGIDFRRICGAAVNDIKSGSLDEGASTITQQLIKNSHLTNKKTFLRKAQEAILALQLEQKFSKDEILEMYLNYVYFGRGAYGIQAAAQAYFNKDAENLTVDEGAMLIGLLKAPNKYAPHINYEKSVKRRNSVLEKMCRYGFISEEEREEYSKKEPTIAPKEETGDYGYFTDYVLSEGAEALGITVSDFMGSGYTVYTSLDSRAQEDMQNIFADESNFPDENVQGAAVVLDNSTGGIRAMVGGREHEGLRLYNRAAAKRQPGSTIKPLLVYAPAFENKSITAATVLDDYRKDFSGYAPSNFKEKYYGKTTVRQALALSLNVPAVEVLEENGIEYSKTVAEKMGIEFDADDRYLALALGGMKYGVSPLELAGAYRTLAVGGEYQKPWCIEKICDGSGDVIYTHDPYENRAISDSTAYILTDILCGVSKQNSNALKRLSYPVACKTGTVGYKGIGYSDAWSATYSSENTVCVWLGCDKTDEENYLDESVTGSSYPSKIAYLAYKSMENGESKCTAFKMPETVKRAEIDLYSLEKSGEILLATDRTKENQKLNEVFQEDTVPVFSSEYWCEPKTPEDVTLQFNELMQAEIRFTAKQSFAKYVIIKRRGGEETEIKTLSGIENTVLTYTDENFLAGDEYSILPEHGEITAAGRPLTGDATEYYTLH